MAIYNSIAIVDFSHMLVVNFSSMGAEHAGENTLAELHALRASTEHVVIALDSKPYFRNQIHADYKKRPPRDPQLISIWERCIERVRDEGYQIAKAPGEEADDVMAKLTAEFLAMGCRDIRLVTQDKDVLQLVGEHVRVFYPITGKRGEFEIRGPEFVMKEYGVHPQNFALLLAMMGDASDHIPGIKGWGKKTGAKYINGYGADHTGNAAAIIAEITNGLVAADKTAKIEEKQLSAEWRQYQAGMAELGKWLQLTTARTNIELERPAESYLEKLESRFPEEEQPLEGEFVDDGAPTQEELDAEAEMMRQERAAMAAELPVDPAPLRTEPERDPAERRAAMSAEADRVLPLPKGEGAPAGAVGTGTAAGTNRPEKVPLPKGQAAPHTTAGASQEAGGAAREMVIGKDPKADEKLRELAAARSSGSTAAPTPPAGSGPSAPTATKSEPAGTQPAHSAAGTSASPQPAATQPAAAPSSSSPQPSGRVEVVPTSQGPAKPKLKDDLGEPEILAITPVAAPNWALSTQPHSAGQAFAIAKRLHQSGLWTQRFKTEAQVAAIILRGRELGIGMTTALEAFYIVRGRPFASAQLISGLAEQDKNHDYAMLKHLDTKRAVVEIKHKRQPKPVDWEYTIDEAEKLGLLAPSKETGGLSQWVLRPKTMLAKTVRVIGERYMFPAATLGLHALEMEPEAQHLVKADDS